MNKVLVVDDDPQIRETLKRQLHYEGYVVTEAGDYRGAFDAMERNPPDLVILDLMLPGMGGVEIARVIRQRNDVPILMLTAKGTLEDKVQGLDSGADDYVVKPFEADELMARVRALMRRRQPATEVLRFGSLALDGAARQVWAGDVNVDLSSKEFDLLELLMRHPRQVITRETFYDRIWGYDFSGESNILEVYIRYLRSKLESAGSPRYIQTVRGIGYVLREDTSQASPQPTDQESTSQAPTG
jgi:two-component system, OmpR family, response regulator MprA